MDYVSQVMQPVLLQINTKRYNDYLQPSPRTVTLTLWEGLCLFDVKKADQRQSEIK
jgi:hypothetical protein